MNSLLHRQYTKEAVPALMKQFGYKNRMQAPALKKVVVNVGYGKNVKDKAHIEHVEKTLAMVSGQKPVHNKAKKSISNFKIREGQPIGASVTLRGDRMYDFVYKFVHLTLPRVRDFRGLSKNGFDGRGNYTVGLKEQVAFPEVTPASADKFYGLEVTVVTSAKTKAEGLALLTALGFPFREK
jgi:large subunit ribosomal protein L5